MMNYVLCESNELPVVRVSWRPARWPEATGVSKEAAATGGGGVQSHVGGREPLVGDARVTATKAMPVNKTYRLIQILFQSLAYLTIVLQTLLFFYKQTNIIWRILPSSNKPFFYLTNSII
jgi:hypothetical protein